MANKKLKIIFYLLPLIVLIHGVEEYLMGLKMGVTISTLTGPSLMPALSNFSKFQAIYIVYMIMQVILFAVIAILFSNFEKLKLGLLTLIGFLFIYQCHHIVEGIMYFKYNPGFYTSFLFLIAGIFYWKELLKQFATKP
jgi:hypothetical protein